MNPTKSSAYSPAPLTSPTRLKKTIVALAVTQLFSLASHAATISVDSSLDDNGAQCTLRQAVLSINSGSLQGGCVNTGDAFGVADAINFAPSVFAPTGSHIITLTAASGGALSVVNKNVVINGPGAANLTIDGNGDNQIFNLRESSVSIDGVTISGGSTNYNGGGIYANYSSSLSVSNSAVSGNIARSGGGIGVGASSRLTISNSVVSGNSATSLGGGVRAVNSSFISVNDSSVSDNSADASGGGISSSFSSGLVLHNSTVSDNSAARGGGIAVGTSSSANLNNSTVSGNSSSFWGGGVFVFDESSASLSNSTVSGNTAATRGGGIYSFGSTLSLGNSTVAVNSASIRGGGVYVRMSSEGVNGIDISNSIVSGNSSARETDLGIDAGVAITSQSNLFGDNRNTSTGALGNFNPSDSDINATTDGRDLATSAILEPLANNGGPTLTHALAANSPAIDAAKTSACPDRDQRGQSRDATDFLLPIVAGNRKIAVVDLGGNCDIGAVEYSE